jgi:copper chaperone CopZ
MKQEVIVIQNLKCSGCVKTIVDLMESVPEVTGVSVSPEEAEVVFSIPDDQLADKYRRALAAAGYPPEGEDNTLGRKAKSYVSCAIGRMK